MSHILFAAKPVIPYGPTRVQDLSLVDYQVTVYDRIRKLARKQSVLRSRDVESVGIPREYLLRLLRKGELVRLGRGLYTLPGAKFTEHHRFAEVAKLFPRATIGLLSALAFYDLTTQTPHEVWIAPPPADSRC